MLQSPMRRLSPFLPFVLMLFPGCSTKTGEDTGSESSEAGSSTGTSGEAGEATAEAESSGEESAESADSAEASTEETVGDSGTEESTGQEGGEPNCGDETCLQDEYCDWALNLCGVPDYDEGTCKPRPEGCDDFYDPVCGCDGEVYGNSCEANAVGVDVDEEGECAAPDGYFSCGPGFCFVDVNYCMLGLSDIGGEPNYWNCMAVPAGCTNGPDCTCLAGEACGDMCEATGDGGFQLTCPGG